MRPLPRCPTRALVQSQGMTLDFARVSLAKCRSFGQAYVALSRIVGVEGLQVRRQVWDWVLVGKHNTELSLRPRPAAA